MDDGSLRTRVNSVIFCCESFNYTEILRLKVILQEKYKWNCSIIRKEKGFRLCIRTNSYVDFKKTVESYIIPSMAYKLR